MITVAGPGSLAPREEDIKAATRRALVQNVFETNKDKESLMTAMSDNQISVTELALAMDYKIDAIAHLRNIGVPDGFMGLKVWPKEELEAYYKWHAVTPNALNLPNIMPTMAQIQAIMDREFAANKISPAHQIPWHTQVVMENTSNDIVIS